MDGSQESLYPPDEPPPERTYDKTEKKRNDKQISSRDEIDLDFVDKLLSESIRLKRKCKVSDGNGSDHTNDPNDRLTRFKSILEMACASVIDMVDSLWSTECRRDATKSIRLTSQALDTICSHLNRWTRRMGHPSMICILRYIVLVLILTESFDNRVNVDDPQTLRNLIEEMESQHIHEADVHEQHLKQLENEYQSHISELKVR